MMILMPKILSKRFDFQVSSDFKRTSAPYLIRRYMYRWEKSSHVEHLRKHTKEYVSAVHGFLDDVYFSKLPSSASAPRIFLLPCPAPKQKKGCPVHP